MAEASGRREPDQSLQLVSTRRASEMLCVSRSKLYELMGNGSLRYLKIGRARRIDVRALRDLIAGAGGSSK